MKWIKSFHNNSHDKIFQSATVHLVVRSLWGASLLTYICFCLEKEFLGKVRNQTLLRSVITRKIKKAYLEIDYLLNSKKDDWTSEVRKDSFISHNKLISQLISVCRSCRILGRKHVWVSHQSGCHRSQYNNFDTKYFTFIWITIV